MTRSSDTKAAVGEQVQLDIAGAPLIDAGMLVNAVAVNGAGLVGATEVSIGHAGDPEAFGTYTVVGGVLSAPGTSATPQTFAFATHVFVRALDGVFTEGTLQATLQYQSASVETGAIGVDPSLISQLRILLHDRQDDNFVKDKAFVIGTVDGTNRRFMTLEDRLLGAGSMNGYAAPRPMRVFFAGAELPAADIVITDSNLGEVTLATAPEGGSYSSSESLRAHYYWQKWRDDELALFLTLGAQQCSAASPETVQAGLRAAMNAFASSYAHNTLAERFQQRKSTQLLLEEAAMERMDGLISHHAQAARSAFDQARSIRGDFYSDRFGKKLVPAVGVVRRSFHPWTPRR